MPIKSLSQSSLLNFEKYSSMLAGNDPYIPFIDADDILEEIVLTSSTSSVTFSGLDNYSDYKHLQIRFTIRDTNPNDVINNPRFYFNGDYTNSNYAEHILNGSGSAVSSNNYTSRPYFLLRDVSAGDSNTAGIFGTGVIDILDFSSTSKFKTIRSLHGGCAVSESDISLQSGLWQSTSAITSLEFDPGSVDFVAGSRFSLIGVR